MKDTNGNTLEIGDRVKGLVSGMEGTVVDTGIKNGREYLIVKFDSKKYLEEVKETLLKKIGGPIKNYQLKKGDRVEGILTGRTGTIVHFLDKEPYAPDDHQPVLVRFDDETHDLGETETVPLCDLKKYDPMNAKEKAENPTREQVLKAYDQACDQGKKVLKELYPETINEERPDLLGFKYGEKLNLNDEKPMFIGVSKAPEGMEDHCLLFRKDAGEWVFQEHPDDPRYLVLYCKKH